MVGGEVGEELKELSYNILVAELCGRGKEKERLYKRVPESLRDVYFEMVGEASQLVYSVRGNTIYCGLCGSGPFTRKGLCMHVLRKHRVELEKILERLLSEKIVMAGKKRLFSREE